MTMKVISLTLSIAVFVASAYFFITDFTLSSETNYMIYMALLVVLMLICIVGVMINLPVLLRERRKMKTLIYNSYSQKRIRNKEFDSSFEII